MRFIFSDIFPVWVRWIGMVGVVTLFALTSACSQVHKSSGEMSLGERLKRLESAAQGVGSIMSNVQLHFAKLYYAAEAKNWKLARFEVHEIEEGLEKSAILRPSEHGVQLMGLLDAFKQTQITAMKIAVEQQDINLFYNAYTESIDMCNSCHRVTGYPFIVIVKPTAPPVPNQQWEPPTE